MSGVFFWMAEQIRAFTQHHSGAVQAAPPYNPNPPGTIHEGSTTEAVLRVLSEYHPRWLTYSQLVDFTGKSPKSVSWSLCYLKQLKAIEARRSGDQRSPLYQMYHVICQSTTDEHS